MLHEEATTCRGPSLLVLPDLRPGVGYGHLSRTLALAAEWTRRGGAACLEGPICSPQWQERCTNANVRIVPPGTASPSGFAWTVVDGYEASEQTRARVLSCRRLAAIDDHGQGGWAGMVGLVVDPNVGASSVPSARSLAGSRYALIRREVLAHAGSEPVGRSVLLVGGGSPPPAIARWMEDVAGLLPVDVHVDVARGGRDLAGAMAKADLVVTAAGTAVLEACALGRAVVAFTWAENHRPGASRLADAGIPVLGDVSDVDPVDGARAIVDLLGDRERLDSLRPVCSALVDGRGVRRVASRLLGELVGLRWASEADIELLWRWANDPVVRSVSFSSAPIPLDEHLRWARLKLADPASDIAVADWFGAVVGQVRFDRHGSRAEVALSLDADWRGRGLGGPLLAGAVAWYFDRHEDVQAVDAAVRVENAASHAAFLDADFDTDGILRDNPAPHLRYSRRRDGLRPGG